jgi:signal transduction histidine kinase
MNRAQVSAESQVGSLQAQEERLEKMARRWRHVLRTVFVLLAAGVWLMVLEDIAHERRQTVAAVAERDSNLAVAVEHYITRILRNAHALHTYLGRLVDGGRPDAEMMEALKNRLAANDAFNGLLLCFPGGKVLEARREPAAKFATHGPCTAALDQVNTESGITVLPPVTHAGVRSIPLALSVHEPGGARLAVAVAMTSEETMLGVMRSAVLRDATLVSLSRSDGTVLAAWTSRGPYLKELPGPESFPQTSGFGHVAVIAGQEHFVGSRSMPLADLRIHVASAQKDALAMFSSRRLRIAAIALLVTGMLAAMYMALRRLHRQGRLLASDLITARASLTQVNQRLDAKVQERTAQLESAYRDIETFAYAIAHDVRAPLGSIAGFAQAIEPALSEAKNARHLHYLHRIQANAARMEELTSQLLALGRLTTKPITRVPIDLTALANDVLAGLREREPNSNADVQIEEGLRTSADASLLRQVLENLLGNAWKFTSREASPRISLVRAPGEATEDTFEVRDNGVGFDSQSATGLFQPFRRMHTDAEFAGNGVGLAAVRQILVKHGGRVWCTSEVGAGARFYFALPRTQAP